MTTLINTYSIFEDNQVLTSSQLNSIREYLDQQNRLTRTCLIGMGIVCGLDLSVNNAGTTVTIAKGVGVTSEGFLITLKECVCTQYRNYTFSEEEPYDFFTDKTIPFLELLTDAIVAKPTDTNPPIALTESVLANKVVLLYLECYEKDLASCIGKSCDQLGKEQIFTIRKLLIDRNKLEETLVALEHCQSGKPYPDQELLKDISMPRIFFDPTAPESENYFDFSANYSDAVHTAIHEVYDLLEASYDAFEPVLKKDYFMNPFTFFGRKAKLATWKGYYHEGYSAEYPFIGMQYFYGFVKDLILAYREFREAAAEIVALSCAEKQCCNSDNCFPKHLMLGLVYKDNLSPCEQTQYRHGFYQPAIYNNQKERIADAQHLFRRTVVLMDDLYLNRLGLKTGLAPGVKMTPSCEKKSDLSQRSIPYYYQLLQVGIPHPGISTLEYYWDTNLKKICRGDGKKRHYDRQDSSKFGIDPITTPFEFDLDPFDFIRIEGHLGLDVADAKNQIEYNRRIRNLSFDLKTVYLGQDDTLLNLPDCLCSDLQLPYTIWRNNQWHFFSNLLHFTYALETAIKGKKDISEILEEYIIGMSDESSSGTKGDFQTSPPVEKPKPGQQDAGSASDKGSAASTQATKASSAARIAGDIERKQYAKVPMSFVQMTSKIKKVQAETYESETTDFETSDDQRLYNLIRDFNRNLRLLLMEMPEDIKDFEFSNPSPDKEAWLGKYKEVFQTNINIMKMVADQPTFIKNIDENIGYLIIYCFMHKGLLWCGEKPYNNIRTIWDTLEMRKREWRQSMRFSNFVAQHPGLEHQAGVKPGGTFVLVYQSTPEEREITVGDAGTPVEDLPELTEPNGSVGQSGNSKRRLKRNLPPSLESYYLEMLKGETTEKKKWEAIDKGEFETEMMAESLTAVYNQKEEETRLSEGRKVIADFTLPYRCCDECPETPSVAIKLKPIALPRCAVAPLNPDRFQKINPPPPKYLTVEFQLLNNNFAPNDFKVRLTNDPTLGTIEEKSMSWQPRPIQKKQLFIYTVDLKAIAQKMKQERDYIFVDTIGYEYLDGDGNLVDSSTMTVFIPVARNSDTDDREVQLNVVAYNRVEKDGQQMQGVTVTVSGSKKATDKNGIASFSVLLNNEFDIRLAKQGYKTIEVKGIKLDDLLSYEFSYVMEAEGVADSLKDKVEDLVKAKDIDPASKEAVDLFNQYATILEKNNNNSTSYKTTTLVDDPLLKMSEGVVAEFTTGEASSITKVSQKFTRTAAAYNTILNDPEAEQGILYKQSHQNLWTTYMTRAMLEEIHSPSQAVVETIQKTIADTANIKDYAYKEVLEEWKSSLANYGSPAYVEAIEKVFEDYKPKPNPGAPHDCGSKNLSGKVSDLNDRPLPVAVVKIECTDQETRTDENGEYGFENVPDGDHKMTASAPGYKPQQKEVCIHTGTAKEVNFQLEPEDDKKKTILKGTVRNLKGNPIPDATVLLEGTNLETKTDSKGEFELENLISDNYNLIIKALNYNPMMNHNFSICPGATEIIDVVLTPNETPIELGTLGGTVFQSKKFPLLGATVKIPSLSESTETDDDGNYHYGDLEPGTYEVTVQKDGYEEQTLSITIVAGENAVLDFILDKVITAGSLRGNVVYEGDIPLMDALITIESNNENTRTDKDGDYRFEELEAGTYEVLVQKEGYDDQRSTIEVEAGVEAVLNFYLEKIITTGSLEGVVNTLEEEPIGDATVTIIETGQMTKTNASGRYTIPKVEAGSYSVLAEYNGYVAASQAIEIEAQRDAMLDFILEQIITTGSLGGMVNSIGQGPLSETKVTITETGQSTITDRDGSYYFDQVEEGNYNVEAQREGFTYVNHTVDIMAQSTKLLNFELEKIITTGGLEGSVSSGGQPLGGASIKIPILGLNTRTNKEGRFYFEEIEAGNYEVLVQMDGYSESVQSIGILAKETAILDFYLDKIAITGSLHGVVKSKEGLELQEALVSIEGVNLTTITNKYGQYFFNNITEDEYNVVVKHNDYRATYKTIFIEAGIDKSLNFELEKMLLTGNLLGRVLHEKKPVPGTDISIPALGLSARAGQEGEFNFEDLPAGTYEITAIRDGYENKTAPFEIWPGSTSNLTINIKSKDVPSFGTIRGAIRNASNKLIKNAKAAIIVNGEKREVLLNRKGLYAFEAVPVGHYKVTATGDDHLSQTKETGVSLNQISTVDFQLLAIVRTGTLSGAVIGRGDGALVGASVMIKEIRLTTVTNRVGEYSFDNIPAGNYNVVASAKGYGQKPALTNIDPGENETLNFQLQPQLMVKKDKLGIAIEVTTKTRGNKIDDSLNVKMSAIHNRQLNDLELVKKEIGRPNKSINVAFECIKVFSSMEEMTLEEVNGIYGESAEKLLAQINHRNQKNKKRYADLLMGIFTAYLNRLMILQPNRPIGKAEELIERTGQAVASIAEYPIEDVIPDWQQSVHGVTKNSFTSKVKKLFYSALT